MLFASLTPYLTKGASLSKPMNLLPNQHLVEQLFVGASNVAKVSNLENTSAPKSGDAEHF